MSPRKERNLKLIDGKWYLDFTFKGKRIRQFGGYTLAQARNTLVKMKAELLDVARGFKKPEAEDVEFGKFCDDFLTLYCKQNKKSWSRDALSLNSLKRFFKGETLASIGPEKIEAFKAKRRTEVSDSTANRELSCLKTALNMAVSWGKIEKSPAARVKKFREPAGRERILTRDEFPRLIAAASLGIRLVLLVALGTGMRRGEILGLKWTDLDFPRGIISIRTSKSGKPRQVPMSASVAEALGAVPRRGEFVFMNSETRTHLKSVTTAFKAACRRAKMNPDDEKDPGITGLRFHDLRHTALTWMLQGGADIVSVSKIAGHSSIIMTQRYCHATPESMRLAVDQVGKILDSGRQEVDTPPGTKITASHIIESRQDN